MPAAGLFEQAFQTGGPGIVERSGSDHSQPADLANPFLHLFLAVETRLFLAKAWEMLPPDRSGVLIRGAGVNEDQAVLLYGAAIVKADSNRGESFMCSCRSYLVDFRPPFLGHSLAR